MAAPSGWASLVTQVGVLSEVRLELGERLDHCATAVRLGGSNGEALPLAAATEEQFVRRPPICKRAALRLDTVKASIASAWQDAPCLPATWTPDAQEAALRRKARQVLAWAVPLEMPAPRLPWTGPLAWSALQKHAESIFAACGRSKPDLCDAASRSGSCSPLALVTLWKMAGFGLRAPASRSSFGACQPGSCPACGPRTLALPRPLL